MPVVTNLYGEHDVFTEYRSHVAAALIKKFADAVATGSSQVVCWGTGAPVREFIYVGDAAEAVARLLKSGYTEPLNIGTGVGTSIRELAELVGRLTGFRGEIVWDRSNPDGVLRKVLDVCRMESILGWKPPTSLEAGLVATIRWYLANKAAADARRDRPPDASVFSVAACSAADAASKDPPENHGNAQNLTHEADRLLQPGSRDSLAGTDRSVWRSIASSSPLAWTSGRIDSNTARPKPSCANGFFRGRLRQFPEPRRHP